MEEVPQVTIIIKNDEGKSFRNKNLCYEEIISIDILKAFINETLKDLSFKPDNVSYIIRGKF